MEKTFKAEELTLIGDILSDAKSVREGKLQSFMLAEDSAKKITVFTVGPEHNCKVVMGEITSQEVSEEFFTFSPEDIEHGIRNSEGHVTITATPKKGTIKFRSNNRKTFRTTEVADPSIKSRLNLFDSLNKGTLLFRIKSNDMYSLFNAMTVGCDSQSSKTTFTRFKLEDPTKLRFYKYSTDSSAIFGSIEISEGNITHDMIAAHKNSFYVPESFPTVVRSIMRKALKDESGRLIDVYFNGHALTISYVTDKEVSIDFIFNGVLSDDENATLIERMSSSFDSNFADVFMNTDSLLSVLRDAEATTAGSSCFIKLDGDTAHIESSNKVGDVPIYENTIVGVRADFKPGYLEENPKFVIPILTSTFKSLLETYQKFETEKNDQVKIRLYHLVFKSAQGQEKAVMLELKSNEFVARSVVQSW